MNPLCVLAAKGLAGLLIALFARHFWASYGRLEDDLAAARADLLTYQQLARDSAHRTELATALDRDTSEQRRRISTATQELLRDLPSRVPADACALPPGWRVQHDLAAAGVPADPAASGVADGAPVASQEAAAVVTDNYGTYHDLAGRLEGLQRYVKEQCHVHPAE